MDMPHTIKRENLSGWGNYPKRICSITEPEILESNSVYLDFKHSIPRGMGRSYGDASLGNQDTLVVKTKWHNKIYSFDRNSGLIKVQAGISLKEIIELTIPHGWFLPVTPGTKYISLGGALASNVHGKNHHNSGSIAHFVQSFDILTEDGIRHCNPTNELSDLFYATLGGYGLTGIILTISLQLRKIETTYIQTLLIQVKNYEEALQTIQENDQDYEFSIVWIDTLTSKRHLGRGIVMLGNYTKRSDLPKRLYTQPLQYQEGSTFSIPESIPHWLLNNWTRKLFNTTYYHKSSRKRVNKIVHFDSWFYPLDFLDNWNNFYGKKGFVQYQFSIPTQNGAHVIGAILGKLAQNHSGSFLAGLKRIKQDSVALPFCMPGYTMAIDFSLNEPSVFSTLDEFDHILLEYGGRVYLTKDARLSAETFQAMYPEYPTWKKTVTKYAPQRRFYSLLAQRLQL